MTQSDLNRAVARATGETVRTIASRGFSLADPVAVDYAPHPCSIEEKMDGDEPDVRQGAAALPSRGRRPVLV